MTEIEQIIWNNLSPITNQNPNKSNEDIFIDIKNGLKNSLYFAIKDENLVFMFEKDTFYTAKMHIFSENEKGLARQFYSSGIAVIKYFFDNTEFQKVWGFSSDERFVSIVEKSGFWKNEGTLTKSFVNENGELIDQYIFGVTREDCYEYLRKL